MVTIQGSLDRSDFLLDRRLTLTTPFSNRYSERVDEYDLAVPGLIGTSIRVALASTGTPSFDTFLQVIDAETGEVLADSDDDGDAGGFQQSLIISTMPGPDGLGGDDVVVPNEFIVQANRPYKIRVTSFDLLNEAENPYELQVGDPTLDNFISLTQRQTGFINPQTSQVGNVLQVFGQLDRTDFNSPAPGSFSQQSRVDEFSLATSSLNPSINLTVVDDDTSPFDPYLEIVNVDSGIVEGFNTGGGFAQINNFTPTPGQEYRIRVTSFGSLDPSEEHPYTLEASVTEGTVTLTPREFLSVINADNPILVLGTSTVSGNPDEYERVDMADLALLGVPENDRFNLFFLSNGNDDFMLTDAPPPPEPASSLRDDRWVLALDGDDTLTGSDSRDFPSNGNRGADILNLLGGDDVALGGQGSDSIDGGNGDDELGGNIGIDYVIGGNGDDILLGGQDEDLLDAGAGEDVLRGDLDKDILIGGDGNDLFMFRSDPEGAADSINDADVIVDFVLGNDNISLPNIVSGQDTAFSEVSLEPVLVERGGIQSNATAIKLNATDEYLGIINGINPSDVDESLFVASPF